MMQMDRTDVRNMSGSSSEEVGYVYCIRNDAMSAAKVGFSASPIRRMRELQTASPTSLRLICAIPAFAEFEATMHGVLSSRRMSGEWFDDADGGVEKTMTGVFSFMSRAGLTIGTLHELAQPTIGLAHSPCAAEQIMLHADALEAEGLSRASA